MQLSPVHQSQGFLKKVTSLSEALRRARKKRKGERWSDEARAGSERPESSGSGSCCNPKAWNQPSNTHCNIDHYGPWLQCHRKCRPIVLSWMHPLLSLGGTLWLLQSGWAALSFGNDNGMVMHGIFVHVRSMILYYCGRNQFLLLAKAIMFFLLSPTTVKLIHLPDFCCWNTVLNTLTKQPGIALISPLTTVKDMFKFTSAS